MTQIILASQSFKHELQGDSTPWALGNVGDLKVITSEIIVQNYAISTNDNPFIFNNTDGMIGGGWIQDPQNQFGSFNVGDSIIIFDQTTSSYQTGGTISAILDHGNIQITGITISGGNNFIASGYVISNTTAINSVKFQYQWAENSASPSFLSQVDSSNQMFVAKSKAASDTTVTAMIPIGFPTWQTGSATIQGAGIDNGTTDGVYKSKYYIVHTCFIPPEIIQAQYQNQFANTPPNDFSIVGKCWTYMTQFQAAQFYTNPNYLVSATFDTTLGNTGWFNENFSTGATNYKIASITYKNSAGQTMPSVDLSLNPTTVTIVVQNTVDSPFVNNNTKFILGFEKVPYDPSEYQTSDTLDDNFMFDRAIQTVGMASVNGAQYGVANRQVLSNVVGTWNSNSQMTITGTIQLLTGSLNKLSSGEIPSYLLYVITQNYTLATDVSDLVTLQADIENFTIDTSDPTMIVVDSTKWLRHPESDPTIQGVATDTVASDPTALTWHITIVSGGGNIGICDATNSLTYGNADWTTDLNTTMNLLVSSINTNTNLGTHVWFGAPTFNNSAGFTATWNSSTSVFTLTAPVGSGTTFNGHLVQAAVVGYWSGDAGVQKTFTGGSLYTFDCYPQDEVVVASNFYIESSGRTMSGIKLTNINARIIAYNGTSQFELDQFNVPLASIPLTGNTQIFDIQQPRPFNVPVGSIRKYIEVKRRQDLDTGTRYYFTSIYPFIVRWETWLPLLQADPSFLNPSLPNNGLNNFWQQYQTGSWELYYELSITATENGTPQQYQLKQPFVVHNYLTDSDYTYAKTFAFESSDLALLMSGTGGAKQLQSGGAFTQTVNGQVYYIDGNSFAYLFKKTLIVAFFEKTTSPAYVTVEMNVEVYQQGGVVGERIYSSKWASDGNSWFYSVDGSNKVVVHQYGDVVIGLAYFDPTQDPNFPTNATQLSFSSRIYEISDGTLTTDDSVTITTDGGLNILQD